MFVPSSRVQPSPSRLRETSIFAQFQHGHLQQHLRLDFEDVKENIGRGGEERDDDDRF